jgi:TetR/AcrR family transcriptional regulator, cholesterol catabolism regulator
MAREARKRGSAEGQSGPVTRDPDATRAALVESALALFEEHGYDATPVQRIADEAGLTKGAFYHHFESKEHLLKEIHDTFIDYELERARALLQRDAPADELLVQFVTEISLEPLSLYKRETIVFLQERRFFSEEAFAEVKRKRDEFEAIVVELIERGIAEGVFRDIGPPKLLAFGVIGAAAWAYTWVDPEGPSSLTELGQLFGRMLIDGLAAERPSGD